KIYTSAKDISLNNDAPAQAKGFTGNLVGLLNQIPGEIISALLGFDASVIIRGADAKLFMDDATVTSDGSVDIKSEVNVASEVNAIALGLGLTAKYLGMQAAVGYGQTHGDADTEIGGSTSITAGDSISITAKGKASTKVTSRASSNLLGAVDPKNTS